MSESRARSLRRALRNDAPAVPAGIDPRSRAFRRAVILVKAGITTRLPRSPEARARVAVEAREQARRVLISTGRRNEADALLPQESARTVYAARPKGDGLDGLRIDRSIWHHERRCDRRLREARAGGWLRC